MTEVLLTPTEVFLTMTEVFPCFFLTCKTNARVKLAKTGHGPHSFTLVVICVVILLFVLFCVLFVCKCMLYYCHWVTTQLQLTNISYHSILSYHIMSYIILCHISYHIMYHHIMSYIISYHVIYHIMSHIISYYVSYHIMSYIISYHVTYHIILCIISYHVTYRVISYHIIFFYLKLEISWKWYIKFQFVWSDSKRPYCLLQL